MKRSRRAIDSSNHSYEYVASSQYVALKGDAGPYLLNSRCSPSTSEMYPKNRYPHCLCTHCSLLATTRMYKSHTGLQIVRMERTESGLRAIYCTCQATKGRFHVGFINYREADVPRPRQSSHCSTYMAARRRTLRWQPSAIFIVIAAVALAYASLLGFSNSKLATRVHSRAFISCTAMLRPMHA